MPPKVFTQLDWTVLSTYFLLVLGIGAFFSKKQSNDRSFFLGGRSMPPWTVALSLVATLLSAVTFIGAPQEAFKGDLSYLILNLGGIIAVVIIAIFFIPAFYKANTITIYGYLEKRFSKRVRFAAGLTFLFGRLLASGARLFAAALGTTLLFYGTTEPTPMQLISVILLLGVTGTLYTLSGGIKAVIWTDVLQICVVVGAALLSIWTLFSAIPLSFSEIITTLSADSKLTVVHTEFDFSMPYTLWTGAFAIVFLQTASYGVDQDLAQRLLTCRSSLKGSLSLIAANLLGIAVLLLFMTIGLLLYLFNDPNIMGENAANFEHSALVYPQFLIQYLPSGLSGIGMAGLLAAAMSSLDSAINAMASSAIADVWRPIRGEPEFQQGASKSRLVVLAMGCSLTLFATFAALSYNPVSDTLLSFALGVMSYAYSGLLGVFFTGLFTKRGNDITVILALLSGAITVLLLQPHMLPKWFEFELAWPWWMVFGTMVSFSVANLGKAAPAYQKELSMA